MAATALVAGVIGAGVADAGPKKLTITSEGKTTIKSNQYFQSALLFAPGKATVQTGAALVVKDNDATGEPHTITFVKKADYPRKERDYLACKACNAALAAHAPNGEPPAGEILPVIDANVAGVDGPGDSLFFGPGQPAKSKITAKPGTTLYFVCAIHPWMQGTLKVTK